MKRFVKLADCQTHDLAYHMEFEGNCGTPEKLAYVRDRGISCDLVCDPAASGVSTPNPCDKSL